MKDKLLTHRQSETLKKAPSEWGNLPSGIGCTNSTLKALEIRGLVEVRIDPSARFSWCGGWQWRRAQTTPQPTDTEGKK